MFNPIKKFFNNLTFPVNAECCESGDYWIPIFWNHPHYNSNYHYNYQRIKQNRIGIWVREDMYLQRNFSNTWYMKQHMEQK